MVHIINSLRLESCVKLGIYETLLTYLKYMNINKVGKFTFKIIIAISWSN